MTKIDIISGFLGAGKTTLIRKLLKEALQGEQVVLIENEFGEIGIDGGFLKESGIQIREMNSGCICCSLVGDFGTSLKEVIDTYHPDRILIEPSGVGKLSDVMKAVENVQQETGLVLNSYTTVVDAKKCKMYMRNFGEFFDNQVEYAGAIILTRTDVADEQKIEEALELIRGLNEKAVVITTPLTELAGSRVLDVMEHPAALQKELVVDEDDDDDDDEDEEEHEHHHHHHHDHDHDEHDHDHHHHHHGHHHADDVFTSWGEETVHRYSRETLEGILEKLSSTQEYGNVLRAKGMVSDPEGTWLYFDMVPGEVQIRQGAPDYTGRICVIGAELKEDDLAELFEL